MLTNEKDSSKKTDSAKEDLGSLYKQFPKGSVISDPNVAERFLLSGERKKYDGGTFPHECEGLQFNYHDFVNVSAKGAVFKKCDFKYSTLTGAYFKNAKFFNCDFTGARFKDCNFKESTFSSCNFKYAEFSGSHIPNTEILLNMPSWLNVRRDLMKTLRKNAESVGDTKGTKLFIREEIKASREYCQKAWRHAEDYYRQKYPNTLTRTGLFFQAGGFFLDDFFWGHGEYPLRLARFILIVLAAAALIVFFNINNLRATPAELLFGLYLKSFLVSIYSFLGVGLDSTLKLPTAPETLKLALALFRYVAVGFFTTSLFRFLSRR